MHDSLAAKQFIAALVSRKNLDGVDGDVVEQLKSDLLGSLERKTNHALIENLNGDQLLKFEHLIDTHQYAKIQPFLERQGVNVHSIIARVMIEFQAAYLGAKED